MNYLTKNIPVLICLIMFSSCQVFNPYKAPKVDAGSLFRDENPEDTTTIADIPWKDFFSDTILQNLINEGLENNYDLRITYSRIKQAEENLSIARWAYFPNIALSGQVTHNRSSVDPANGEKNVLGIHSEQYSLGIAASWELDIWGKLNRQSRAGYAQMLASYEYRNLIMSSLIANIATSYYSLLALDRQLVITHETIELLKQSAATMEALMTAGMLNEASIKQSEALRYNTQISVPELESQIRQLENSICVLLGRKPGPVVRGKLEEQSIVTELKHGVPAQMLAKRPDVKQAELSFRSAFELTNAAQASLYPSITLNTGSMIGYGATTLSNFFKPENLILSLLGGITQPLLAGKQLRGQLRVRKAQQEEALLTFEKTVLSAGQEVSDIIYSYNASLRKNPIREMQVKALTDAVDFTQELLKAGEANYTEVLTAEQNLLQAQLSQVNDQLEQLQYSVNLYKALGGGIK